MKVSKYIGVFLMILIFISCDNKATNTSTNTLKQLAQGFEIKQFTNYIRLTIKSPYPNSESDLNYFLVNDKTDLSLFKSSDILIQIPVQQIVVTSTTHIPMLELLNVQNTLVGFPNTEYISSKKTRKLIAKNKIQELGNDNSINTEILIDLQPTLVMAFAMSAGNKSLGTIEKAGIPVIYNGDWLEKTPLGRAEWIRVFGALYNLDEKADSIFKTIESQYNKAKEIASVSKRQHSILSGVMFKDVWNLPAGESFVAQFLKDANTNYLWKDTKGTGSLQLNFENVLDKAKDAEIWIAPGHYTSKEQLLNASSHYIEFDAFNKNNIYTFANKKGETGGVLYYELAPTRPDLVLKDIIKIVHPELMGDYEFTFFERMK
ncbi:MAG: ABC transporter substrate-binding protein [Flavobacteriaceae bacterium]